jgi:NADPH:quinone reductase-like Zn-dependent oxidoreductase
VNHENGAFAEIIPADARLSIKIPDNITNEEAATLGVSVSTCVSGVIV